MCSLGNRAFSISGRDAKSKNLSSGFCAYRDETCVIFTGWPISVAGSAPGLGMNFWVRPPKVSAA
jgi:hypothetical protein